MLSAITGTLATCFESWWTRKSAKQISSYLQVPLCRSTRPRGPETGYYGGSGDPEGGPLCGIAAEQGLARVIPAVARLCRTVGAPIMAAFQPAQRLLTARKEPWPPCEKVGSGGKRRVRPIEFFVLHDACARARTHRETILNQFKPTHRANSVRPVGEGRPVFELDRIARRPSPTPSRGCSSCDQAKAERQ